MVKQTSISSRNTKSCNQSSKRYIHRSWG